MDDVSNLETFLENFFAVVLVFDCPVDVHVGTIFSWWDVATTKNQPCEPHSHWAKMAIQINGTASVSIDITSYFQAFPIMEKMFLAYDYATNAILVGVIWDRKAQMIVIIFDKFL